MFQDRFRRSWTPALCLLGVSSALAWCSPVLARDLDATPATLGAMLGALEPGDTLHLASGTYAHFTVTGLEGTAAMPIVITGPSDLSAIVRADDGPCCNTIQIRDDVSFVELRALTIDGHGVDGAFGVDARGANVHHITIENCTFIGHDASQQTVAISTKTATAGWVIRGNRILGAGTGMYLGNSDGTFPFVEGLIEHNLVFDTLGYNIQIKWQQPHGAVEGASAGPTATIIRHNVFIKTDRASPDGDRPNLLLGGFPSTGANAEDSYQVYGNLFVHNPREALLQVSGRVSVHDNVFLDSPVAAIRARDHDLPLRRAWIYHNTILVAGTGVSLSGAAPEGTRVVGNAIFAGTPVTGSPDVMSENTVGALLEATSDLMSGSTMLGAADPHPRLGALGGAVIDTSPFVGDVEFDRDFNCRARGPDTIRGAYASEGENPGWHLAMENKPRCDATPMIDAGIDGDSGVSPGVDGGSADAAGLDGGRAVDAGMEVDGGGCACRARTGRDGGRGRGAVALVVVLTSLVLTRRRRGSPR